MLRNVRTYRSSCAGAMLWRFCEKMLPCVLQFQREHKMRDLNKAAWD